METQEGSWQGRPPHEVEGSDLVDLVDALRGVGAVIETRPLTIPEQRQLVLLLAQLRQRLTEVVTASVLVGRAVAAYVYWATPAAAVDQPVPAGLDTDVCNRLAELVDRTAAPATVARRRTFRPQRAHRQPRHGSVHTHRTDGLAASA